MTDTRPALSQRKNCTVKRFNLKQSGKSRISAGGHSYCTGRGKTIVERIAERLGMKLTKVRTCKEADTARRDFVKFMGRR